MGLNRLLLYFDSRINQSTRSNLIFHKNFLNLIGWSLRQEIKAKDAISSWTSHKNPTSFHINKNFIGCFWKSCKMGLRLFSKPALKLEMIRMTEIFVHWTYHCLYVNSSHFLFSLYFFKLLFYFQPFSLDLTGQRTFCDWLQTFHIDKIILEYIQIQNKNLFGLFLQPKEWFQVIWITILNSTFI